MEGRKGDEEREGRERRGENRMWKGTGRQGGGGGGFEHERSWRRLGGREGGTERERREEKREKGGRAGGKKGRHGAGQMGGERKSTVLEEN